MMSQSNALQFFCLLFPLLTFTFWSQTNSINQLEEVFVSSSRLKLSKADLGKSVVKISAHTLEQNKGLSLSQVLNTQVGFNITGSLGQSGSVLTTAVRGGQNRQVLVLIDGIPVNDPSQIENNFDLNLIGLEQIEFIEILKGASSVLYGSNASTAVINIVSKKAQKNNFSVKLSSMVGTQNSAKQYQYDPNDFQNRMTLLGAFDKINFSSHISYRSNDGMSSISSEDLPNHFDKDAFSKFNYNFRLGYQPSHRLDFLAHFNWDQYASDYDESFGFLDANYNLKQKQFRLGFRSKYEYQMGHFILNSAINANTRSYDSSFPASFEGRTLNLDFFNTHKFNRNLQSVAGIKYARSQMRNDVIPFGSSEFQTAISSENAFDSNIDLYANVVLTLQSGFNLNTGIRLNNHSEYKSHLVYSITPSYRFQWANYFLKINASFGTAFISPSLYQLFEPTYGNSNLNPQKDSTFEVGFQLVAPGKFEIEGTFFRRFQQEYIDFVITDASTFSGNYQNIMGNTTVQGVESSVIYDGLDRAKFRLNYAFTESHDRNLYRIPKHKINFEVSYEFSKRIKTSISQQYVSQRRSTQVINAEHLLLNAYHLTNIGIQYEIGSQWGIFARCINVLDTPIQEIYRFNSIGRNYLLGFNYAF